MDPSKLSGGAHYAEVEALDSEAEWRGPLFRCAYSIELEESICQNSFCQAFAGLMLYPSFAGLQRTLRLGSFLLGADSQPRCAALCDERSYEASLCVHQLVDSVMPF